MYKNKLTRRAYNLALCAVVIVAAVILTLFVYTALTGPVKFLAPALLAAIVITQLLQLKALYRHEIRARRFKHLARKLVKVKKEKQRDEKFALKILNHVNSANDLPASSHTSIWQKPLHGFSGDLAMAYESECGKKYTILADLTGHGIAAAIGAAPVASIFRATASRGLPLEEIVTELNNRLEQLLPSGFFCCAAVIVNDNGNVAVCNAGLPDILIADSSGEIVDQVSSEQIPFGIESTDKKNVQAFTKTYPAPHRLYAVTDGLIETIGANDETFDMDRLTSLLKTHNSGSRIRKITEEFESFSKGSTPTDDISIVEVKI